MVLWTSDHPTLEIPQHLTTWQWAFESEKYSPLKYSRRANLGAYEDAISKQRLDFVDVKEKVVSLSTALTRKYGFQVGDTTSLFSSNNIWYPVALWATVRNGGRVNGASSAYNAEEMAYAMKTAKTKFLFTLPGALPVATSAAKQAGLSLANIFLLEGKAEGFTTIQELIELGKSLEPCPTYSLPNGTSNKDVCGYLNFSSGTTGLPKAVMLSHHNIIAQCHQLRQLQVVEPGEQYSVLAVMPMFHITGLIRYVHYPVHMNGTSIVLPSFDLEKMLQIVISYRIRELILVPPIIIRIVRDSIVAKYENDLRATVKRWSSGSAPTAPEIIELLRQKFPDSGFRQGYGATESSACISCHPPDCYDYKYASSAGKLCANTVAKVMDLNDPTKELGPNQVGEILARGPQIAMGYLDNPKATAETFDADGFFHTGDVGRIDSEGFLRIEDRIKEMIKVRGQQVAPAELEDCLQGHEAVADCAVLGIPDDYSGEKPKAYVVLRTGHEPSEVLGQQLLRWVADRKSRYKWIRELEFTASVPKSPTGKLLRRILKANDRDPQRSRGICVRDDANRAKL